MVNNIFLSARQKERLSSFCLILQKITLFVISTCPIYENDTFVMTNALHDHSSIVNGKLILNLTIGPSHGLVTIVY